MKIRFYKFNNYSNRTCRALAEIWEYNNEGTFINEFENISFNKKSEKEAYFQNYISSDLMPDYALLCKDNGEIISRWFVINENRGNNKNYTLELKRDFVADFMTQIISNQETLVKRGFPKFTNDSFLNDEREFSFNEYKRNQKTIQNNLTTGKAWVALFVGNSLKNRMTDKTEGISNLALYNSLSSSFVDHVFSFADNEVVRDLTPSLMNKGYNMILIPYAVFTESNATIKTYVQDSQNVYEEFNVKIDNTTYSSNITTYSLMRLFASKIINNETFIDIQVIPFIDKTYADYEYDSVNHELKIYLNTYNKAVGIIDTNENNHKGSIFPFIDDVEHTLSYNFDLSDLGISAEQITKIQNNPKLLEAYKVYIQSPDRTSTLNLDLRKFVNKSTGILPLSFNLTIQTLYQPYQSFVSIKPNNTLGTNYFGSNELDDRALICGYNNQLLRTTNAWQQFLLSNKNYLNSFNLEMRDAKINTATSAITGTIGGATAGAMVGSVVPVLGTAVGAIAGAVVGGTTAVVQGLVNTDEKRKNFEWNCDNLKSKPESVSKVASFVPTNSVYPTINIYYNDEVVNTLFDKYLKYNGATINKIGRIVDYIKDNDLTFVTATILRFDDETFYGTADDLLEIQRELEMGVYFNFKHFE